MPDAGARAGRPLRRAQRRGQDLRHDRLAGRLDDRPDRRRQGRHQPAVATQTSNVANVSPAGRAGRASSGDLDDVGRDAGRRSTAAAQDHARAAQRDRRRHLPRARRARSTPSPSSRACSGARSAGRTAPTTLELADLILEEAKVAIVPGEAFGAPGLRPPVASPSATTTWARASRRIADLLARRRPDVGREVADRSVRLVAVADHDRRAGRRRRRRSARSGVDGDDVVVGRAAGPTEGGRVAAGARSGPTASRRRRACPTGFSARTRVHEYGGGAWWRARATWSVRQLGRPAALPASTPGGARRCRSPPSRPCPGAALRRRPTSAPTADWVVCVRERHTGRRRARPRNEIVARRRRRPAAAEPVRAGQRARLRGRTARCRPDGRSLAWLAVGPPRHAVGRHRAVGGRPSMRAERRRPAVGRRRRGRRARRVGRPARVGRPTACCCSCPTAPAGGTSYRLRRPAPRSPPDRRPSRSTVAAIEAEIGAPQWVFGQSRYARARRRPRPRGRRPLTALDAPRAWSPARRRLASRRSTRRSPRWSSACAPSATARSPSVPRHRREPAVVAARRPRRCRRRRHRRRGRGPAAAARPRARARVVLACPSRSTFPTTGGRTAHALFYPPTNPDAPSAPTTSAPPLVVMIHGGPTSAARPQLHLGMQFWTSRGFAVVDVNYGGSTGYGRPYRDLLHGRVGRRRRRRLRRRRPATSPPTGGSTATGWPSGAAAPAGSRRWPPSPSTTSSPPGPATTAWPTSRPWPRDTHKFESRYLDGLVGPWPEAADVYEERSPIHHTDGLDVPADRAAGPRGRGRAARPGRDDRRRRWPARACPTPTWPFEGEQHGFRRAETIGRALEAELCVLRPGLRVRAGRRHRAGRRSSTSEPGAARGRPTVCRRARAWKVRGDAPEDEAVAVVTDQGAARPVIEALLLAGLGRSTRPGA